MASISLLRPTKYGTPTTKVRSPAALAWRRFRRHKVAIVGTIMLVLLALFVLLGGFAFAHGICSGTGMYREGEVYGNCTDTRIALQPPSMAHPFGTDTIGRDVLARIIYGGQISLAIGLFSALVAVGLGAIVGLVTGYYRGLVDSSLMRFTEAMLSIPPLFLLLVAAKFLGEKAGQFALFGRTFDGSVAVIILVIGLTSWMTSARVVRATTLSLKERDYVFAARTLGASNRRIILQHILPNTTAPIIVAVTLAVGGAILMEAYISYLGLGVRAPAASWGSMLEGSKGYLEQAPWLWLFPGLFIVLTVLSINFVGDGLRDALEPRHQG